MKTDTNKQSKSADQMAEELEAHAKQLLDLAKKIRTPKRKYKRRPT